MSNAREALPLIALEALVLDTETTGLDPRNARVVEIGGVPMDRGRLDRAQAFRRLVRPDEPIPASATSIHGIDAAAIAGAPEFRMAWQELSSFFDKPVLIGHSIGFDLAILKKECERAGVSWKPPRTLCTRMLAELAEPDLPDYSLETVAARVGVEIVGRHSAMGDAVTAAQIFLALVPKLRERNIRTLPEAEQACRALTAALDQQRRAGWVEPVAARGAIPDASARVDTFPYRYRVAEIMTAPAKFADARAPLRAALEQMAHEGISSIFVQLYQATRRPASTGIVTERDVLRLLAKDGAAALDMPLEEAASRPLVTVPANAFAYLAMARMNRRRIRHLGVTDEHGRIVGAVSARDLLRLRFESAIALGDQIEDADDVPDLGRAWAKLPQIAQSLLGDGVSTRDVAAVISRRLGALTDQAAMIAARRMLKSGEGGAPCAYAVAVLGSAGRGESLLAMDQDNALVFAEGEPGGVQDRWFEIFGRHLADILHEAGVPYCKGGVMAKNPDWRGSLATWGDRIDHWIGRSKPEDLLSVDIFFDLRAVHGDLHLADGLRHAAFDAAKGQAGFAKLLADAAGKIEPGLNWFGGFRLQQGRIDLKKAGLFGVVSSARALAVCHHVTAHSTPGRLAGLKALRIGAERDLDALAEAQGLFLELILAQQIEDIGSGRPPANTVAVGRLAPRDYNQLRAALKDVQNLGELIRNLLFRS